MNNADNFLLLDEYKLSPNKISIELNSYDATIINKYINYESTKKILFGNSIKDNISKFVIYQDQSQNNVIERILYTSNDNAICDILYKDGVAIKKSFNFILKNNSTLNVEINNFDTVLDQNFISGSGVFTLSNEIITINGSSKISKGIGARFLAITILKIIISKHTYELNKVEKDMQSIVNLLNNVAVKEQDYFDKCPTFFELSEKIKLPIKTNIFNVICGKYYYYSHNNINILIKYINLFKLLIRYDYEQIEQTMINKYRGNDDLMNKHLNSFVKYIPSNLSNKYIEFMTGDKTFKKINTSNKIIFDSGNSAPTSIGRYIVKELNLPTFKSCEISTHGIGGENVNCGQFVELKFRLDSSYQYANNKVYTIYAFVDDNQLKDTVLFGNQSGLDVLFIDNYSIKYHYDDVGQSGEPLLTSDKINELLQKTSKVIDYLLTDITDDAGFIVLGNFYRDNPHVTENIKKIKTGVIRSLITETFSKIKSLQEKVMRSGNKGYIELVQSFGKIR